VFPPDRLILFSIICLLAAASIRTQVYGDLRSHMTGMEVETGAVPRGGSSPEAAAAVSAGDATKPSDGVKVLYLAIATAFFALFDYISFNLVRTISTALRIYRLIQVLVQLAITWVLLRTVGLPTAIAYNVVWWTWGADALYYVYTAIFNAGGHWERRGAFRKYVLGNRCTWAWWTPVGVAKGMSKKTVIRGDVLIAQSLIGVILALALILLA
jgi:hypothetical protein